MNWLLTSFAHFSFEDVVSLMCRKSSLRLMVSAITISVSGSRSLIFSLLAVGILFMIRDYGKSNGGGLDKCVRCRLC